MAENLLTNPGFEGISKPGESSRATHAGVEFGEISVPKGWVAWWEEGRYRRPEMKVIPKQAPYLDPPRIHSGNWAFLSFAMFGRQHAGLYQRVNGLEPGKRYRFSACAHAWSAHQGELAVEGAHCSAGVGCGPKYIPEDKVPPLNGNAWNDAIGNFMFRVGISFGTPDPFSNDVIWGNGACIYNAYHGVPPLEFIAPGSGCVIVYLKAISLWEFRNSDAYWDATELVLVDESPAPTYESMMLVLPQDATFEQLTEVMQAAYPNRRTFGFSHDDAAVLNGTAVLYNVPDDEKQRYVDWYQAKNPNIRLEFQYTSDWNEWNQFTLCQKDYGGTFGENNCSIAGLGCYITNIAMAQRIYGIKPDATPVTVDRQLGPDGYEGCDALWSAVRTKCRIGITATGDLDTHLNSGLVAMIEVQPTSLQHFVLAVEVLDGDYKVIDPLCGDVISLKQRYQGVESIRFLTPVTTPAVQRKTRGHVGLHLQTMGAGCVEFVQAVKPSVVKVLSSMQDVVTIKAASPETTVVWRHVTNDYGDTLEASDPTVGARRWIAKFGASLYEVMNQLRREVPDAKEPLFYVGSINEVYPSRNEHAVRRAVDFDIAFCDALEELGLPIKPVVFTAAVGNPHESEYKLLVPLARKCAEVGGLMGYHPYWEAITGESRLLSGWPYYAGRWTEMDKVFVQHGVKVRWFGGESGAYATACDGWRSKLCYGGDWNKYFNDIKAFDALVKDWNVNHEDRFLGMVLFTTGAHYTGWETFWIEQPQMEDLAHYLVENY